MTRLLLAALLALPAPVLADVAPLQERIVGAWTSISCEIRPQLNPGDPSLAPLPSYLTRDFTYDADGGFTGVITVYADPACAAPMVTFDFAGDVVWHGENPAAAGALSQDYVLNAKLTIIPKAEAYVAQMNSLPEGACGTGAYEVGVPKDILGKACVLLNNLPAGDFVVDHDLLYMHPDVDDMLFMGAKHVDGTGFYEAEYRPTVGLQQPLIRVR
ncbi:MAG: hypothetical protein AAFX00_08560 [Pseudomonadota bacterium]